MIGDAQIPLYDAHCHLHDARLSPFLLEILDQLREIGVHRVVVNATCEADWPEVLNLAARNQRIIPSLGLHPWFLNERSARWIETLSDAARTHPCAIGEIGLDRWIEGYDSAVQEEVFRQQLALAASLNRPVSIHCLRAWGCLLEILSSEELPRVGFLLHSYGGPAEMIPSFLELGAYFSLSGYFADPRKTKQREAFRHVRLDRLLLETDAPDMALPLELQEFTLPDRLNHPANLRAVYRFAAELLKIPMEEFALQIEKNFSRLFGQE